MGAMVDGPVRLGKSTPNAAPRCRVALAGHGNEVDRQGHFLIDIGNKWHIGNDEIKVGPVDRGSGTPLDPVGRSAHLNFKPDWPGHVANGQIARHSKGDFVSRLGGQAIDGRRRKRNKFKRVGIEDDPPNGSVPIV